MIDTVDEKLKDQVREYWNAHPCGTQFTHLEWGSKEFFAEVERFRYETQPFMSEIIGFDRYPGKRLLEVGCGLGTDLLQFAKGGALVTGVDLTPQSIELVKRRFALDGLAVDARVSDAENLPFDDASFDVVYSFGVLHHTPNTQKAIDEVYRVLKPGGKIIIMHGQADQLIMTEGTVDYYKRVLQQMGGWKKVMPFARLFLIPGAGHGNGGVGNGGVDAAIRWVEAGVAPDKLLYRGPKDRTRPLFPYPQVAKYKGTGSTDDADNFTSTLPANSPNKVNP